jgi:ankyrin repeat protein
MLDLSAYNGGKIMRLHEACEKGNLEIVRLLMAPRFHNDASEENEAGEFPLLIAARYGHCAVVEWLLANAQVDINQQNAKRESALYEASIAGHWKIVQSLLQNANLKVNPVTIGDWTPFLAAIKLGFTEVVRCFLRDSRLELVGKGHAALNITAEKNDLETAGGILLAYHRQGIEWPKRLDRRSSVVEHWLQLGCEEGLQDIYERFPTIEQESRRYPFTSTLKPEPTSAMCPPTATPLSSATKRLPLVFSKL